MKTGKSIYIANQSTDLSINEFSLKCIFEQTRWTKIKKIHFNSIASYPRNKYLQLLKLLCSRMRKHISQKKFSPLPNGRDGGRVAVKFQIWANATYFTFICLIFVKSEEDKHPCWFRNVSPIHHYYCNSPIIRYDKILKIASCDLLYLILHSWKELNIHWFLVR